MRLNNIYGYGQLFCYSGLDGETSYKKDLVGMCMQKTIQIRFNFFNPVSLYLPLEQKLKFSAVTGDMIDCDKCLILFASKNTIIGKSTVKPTIFSEHFALKTRKKEEEKIITLSGTFTLKYQLKNGYYYFTFTYNSAIIDLPTEDDLNTLKQARYEYYKGLPNCDNPSYEQLLSKCYSVNKENVYSPEGIIPCYWTTPDRLPHHHMWLWDSAFHAIAFSFYNIEMAKCCIRSLLPFARNNGFIPHMMKPNGKTSKITQPQVLAWAVWTVYEKCKDKSFLAECADTIGDFLIWTVKNRDKNGNGLLEWLIERDKNCRCGESGWDNSPRFDFSEPIDAIDFSTFLCQDAMYLAKIYKELGNVEKETQFNELYQKTKDAINNILWNDKIGLYFDATFDGKTTEMATPASFLPMLAGIASKEQAEKMVKNLTDESKFWGYMPVPTISKDHPLFNKDMWRGGTWLNTNYFVIKGLKNYGYNQLAEELKEKTLASVNKWFSKTGNIFEFYDPDGDIIPFALKRKGEPINPPDYRKHMHAITDFNWSACFTLIMLLEK